MGNTISKQGDFLQADYFNNIGGLNSTDSPFRVQDTQSIAGGNYDYLYTGGFRKRLGNTLLNASPDSVVNTTGLFIYTDNSNNKTLLRATDSKLQTINKTTGVSTNVTDDTVSAGTTAFTSTQPVVATQFNTASAVTTWFAGGGQSSGIITGYNGTNFTTNGAATPGGSITTADGGSGSATFSTGKYWYAIVGYKGSTTATSNAGLDASYTVGTATNNTDIQLSSLTFDNTKYTQIWIYRSSVGGATGFTAGALVAKLSYNGSVYSVVSGSGTIVSSTKYRDTGSSISSSVAVPRAGNTALDNSVLPAGTYNVITKYRQTLVTAQGSTLYFSDVSKPESWPTSNFLTVPSGGPITGLAVVNFNTATTTSTTEFLAVFKERELWLVTGSHFLTLTDVNNNVYQTPDISLIFVDYVGCPAQSLITNANGFLLWLDYRGVYIWDGANKPIYASRLIEYDFGPNGDIDLTNIVYGHCEFFRKQNEAIWVISSKTFGINKLAIKMDLRLSLANIDQSLAGRILEAVFIYDNYPNNVYGMVSSVISASETLYASGNDGYNWKLYDNLNSDNGTAVQFSYRTRSTEIGSVNTTKRFHKVIVWCLEGNLNNLTLNFWTDYRILNQYKSTQYEVITNQISTAIWDQSLWDNCYWDAYTRTYAPVVFNLDPTQQGVEGEALTLEFQQQDLNSPVTIAGYSVIYSIIGLRE